MRAASFQYSLRSILALTTAFAVLFGVFRWAQLSVWASILVTLLLMVSFVAAFALILALSHSLDDDQEQGPSG